jgi:hypothetical protein
MYVVRLKKFSLQKKRGLEKNLIWDVWSKAHCGSVFGNEFANEWIRSGELL